MPKTKARRYDNHQWVEIGNGKKQKPLVGEILRHERTWRYKQVRIYRYGGYFERQVKSSVIQYDILFRDGSRKWIYQEQILRVQPDPDQQELEAQARELFGGDYV